MINKKVLSETALFFGELKMPKGYEIETGLLVKNIALSHYYDDVEYVFSKAWDKINTFITDFMRVEHKINIQSKRAGSSQFNSPAQLINELRENIALEFESTASDQEKQEAIAKMKQFARDELEKMGLNPNNFNL